MYADVDSSTITVGSFCTGVGWLDLAVRLACEHVGMRSVPAFACEWDAYAAAVLRSRMEDENLESCPIWCGDLRQFPAADFRGVVDAAAFGFPCQDISCAGQGAGIHGARSGVLFDILDAVCSMGCRILFMENVSAITNRGLDSVLAALAELGFDAEWTTLQAAEVGASHKRERWFCVAYRKESRSRRVPEPDGRNDTTNIDGSCFRMESSQCRRNREAKSTDDPIGNSGFNSRDWDLANTERPRLGGERIPRTGPDGGSEAFGTGETVDDAASSRRSPEIKGTDQRGSEQRSGQCVPSDGCGTMGDSISPRENARFEASGSRNPAGESGGQVADGISTGLEERRSERGNAIEELATAKRNSAPIFAPGPGDTDAWRRILSEQPWLAPAIGKEEAQSQFLRATDGSLAGMDDPRADRLRCIGNGVVALQAASAFVGLMRRLI